MTDVSLTRRRATLSRFIGSAVFIADDCHLSPAACAAGFYPGCSVELLEVRRTRASVRLPGDTTGDSWGFPLRALAVRPFTPLAPCAGQRELF